MWTECNLATVDVFSASMKLIQFVSSLFFGPFGWTA